MYFTTTLFPVNYSNVSCISPGINQVISSPITRQLIFHLILATQSYAVVFPLQILPLNSFFLNRKTAAVPLLLGILRVSNFPDVGGKTAGSKFIIKFLIL